MYYYYASTFFMIDPLEQFEMFPLMWCDLLCPTQMTNLTMMLLLNMALIHMSLALIYGKSDKNVWMLIMNNIYAVVKNMVKNNTSLKRSQYFSPLLFLFLFVFISNLTGLIPYSFTITSSFVVTFFLALTHFIGVNLIAIASHRWEFFNLFLPNGVPLAMAPILIPIEFVSYIARVFSLSIRLFANMMSGHALLKILMGFSWTLLGSGMLSIGMAFFPWMIVTAIMFLELLIAFLQAYVFVMLIAIYINDVISMH